MPAAGRWRWLAEVAMIADGPLEPPVRGRSGATARGPPPRHLHPGSTPGSVPDHHVPPDGPDHRIGDGQARDRCRPGSRCPGGSGRSTSGRWSNGIPGPVSSTWRTTRLPFTWTRHATYPPVPAYLQALSTRTPSRSVDPAGSASIQKGLGSLDIHPQAHARGRRRRAGTARHTRGHGGHVGPLARGRRRCARRRSGQPQQIVDDVPQSVALVGDPFQDLPVLLGRTVAGSAPVRPRPR